MAPVVTDRLIGCGRRAIESWRSVCSSVPSPSSLARCATASGGCGLDRAGSGRTKGQDRIDALDCQQSWHPQK